MVKKFVLIVVCGGLHLAVADQGELCDLVNPFIGTAIYNGHTYPGATAPFGMVQPSPDTGFGGSPHCSGYTYEDRAIYGFSQTHLSGTGIGDLQDVLLQPYSGTVNDGDYRGWKAQEVASAGYYAVTYTNFGVRAELTASPRVAYHRYTYAGGRAHVLVDLASGIGGRWFRSAKSSFPSNRVVKSESEFRGDRQLVGHNNVWCWLSNRDIYYVMEFSRPIKGSRRLPPKCAGEVAARYELDFDVPPGGELVVRVAISRKSIAGAERNLMSDRAGFDFDAAKNKCRSMWNGYLSRLNPKLEDREQRVLFYTALYHVLIQPNLISDAGETNEYSTFSNWDTFRAAHPLIEEIAPEVVADVVNSLVAQSRRNGRLPVWGLWGDDTRCMPGDHAVPIIVSAIMHDFKGIDAKAAFEAIDKTLKDKYATVGYNELGYVPCDKMNESVSRTIETSYDDWCAAQLAKKLGLNERAQFYLRRSGFWRNHWDAKSGYLRPRNADGSWLEPFNPFERKPAQGWRQYCEGSAIHYVWHVLHDEDAMIELMGGADKFAARLEKMFNLPEEMPGQGRVGDCSGPIGQYVHGNEPCQHDPWLFCLVGRADLAEKYVKLAAERFYLNRPRGLPGMDDCGQTSAWYVYSVLGRYPLTWARQVSLGAK